VDVAGVGVCGGGGGGGGGGSGYVWVRVCCCMFGQDTTRFCSILYYTTVYYTFLYSFFKCVIGFFYGLSVFV
jgi:hypothetical protein